MSNTTDRRTALQTFSVALAAGAAGLLSTQGSTKADAAQGASDQIIPQGAALADLTERLAAAPRRRSFKTVPMILNNLDQWDHEALSEVLAYKPATKQAWDNSDIGGPWLSLMRNTLNVQSWSFGHPDFLVVSETRGTAQMALYDQAMWDKYGIAKLAGKPFETNTLILQRPAAKADPQNYEDPMGVFSPANNSIPALQMRGVVFMSCHNAIWEHASKLIEAGANPDKLAIDALTAELTNHLVPGVVLTPGAVGTLPELQRAGFAYQR
jgi:intracellular sulfur oxidation DsrE/DsrF family protein